MTLSELKQAQWEKRLPSRTEVRARRAVVVTVQYGLLIFFGLLSFLLVFLMLSMSLRPGVHIYIDYWRFFQWPPFWGNYRTALLDLMPAMGRTLLVCFVSISLMLIIATVASYAFARISFHGRDTIYFLILAVIVIPGIILLTPHFVQANQLRIMGSLWAVIVFAVAGGLPWAIFLITTFFRSQPQSLFEAARIDGASELQSLFRIAVPLAMPILITVAMLQFMSIYGDFIWPTLVLTKNNETLMMALQQYDPPVLGNEGQTRPDLGAQTAGYAFATIPQFILFALGMKYFIKGVTSGAIKV
jgi:ABC-type glycerol-3-phosphate transport system permease component